MFHYEPKTDTEPTDYTGLIIGAATLPVFFIVTYFYTAEMGLATTLLLGIAAFIVKLRWDLRKRVWFWVTLFILLALHVPLIPMFRVPQGKAPTRVYVFPLGLVDFAIFFVTINFVEDFFSSKTPPSITE